MHQNAAMISQHFRQKIIWAVYLLLIQHMESGQYSLSLKCQHHCIIIMLCLVIQILMVRRVNKSLCTFMECIWKAILRTYWWMRLFLFYFLSFFFWHILMEKIMMLTKVAQEIRNWGQFQYSSYTSEMWSQCDILHEVINT